MKPFFATYSPIYRRAKHQAIALAKTFSFLQSHFPDINTENCTTSFCDDLLVINKNHGFLEDHAFAIAMEPFSNDLVVISKIWRIYTYAQQALDAARLGGAIVDLGCYDCKTVEIALRYIRASQLELTKTEPARPKVYCFDAFDNPPAGKKSGHGPTLLQDVAHRLQYLEEDFDLTFVKGYLPESLAHNRLNFNRNQISFVHIDLNNGALDAHCLSCLYPSVIKGGSILLDDYGFANYRETMVLVNKMAASLQSSVLEMPTGQGLIIKRI